MVPITVAEWNEPKKKNIGAKYLEQRIKDTLWDSMLASFSLPADLPQKRKDKVKEWTLSKMAEQFNNWKKTLWRKYVNETPEFTGRLEKIKDDWPEFVAYRKSSVAVARSTQNKLNAKKKKYFHRLGSGGYKTAVPKWESYENELRQKGITPETDDWPDRSKLWLFAHGAVLDMETGRIVAKGKWRKRIRRVVKKIKKAIKLVKLGKYVPDREDDELTLALGNKEHWGRCRARGGGVGFLEGFPEDTATYRKHCRSKKKEADRVTALERSLKVVQEQLASFTKTRESQLRVEDPAGDACPSQRKSSVGSTQLQDDPAPRPPTPPVAEPSAAHYPVDDITEKTNCELHAPMLNITCPVATGYALPHQPGATFHFGVIPAGFARVGVTKIMPGMNSIELEIPGAEGEKTLGDVELGIVLWKKNLIKFPDSAPRPPTPPVRNSPQQSPPSSPDDWDPTASPSPVPSRQPTAAPTSSLTKRKLFKASPVKKRAKKTKEVKAPEKLAGEMTMEELKLSTQGKPAAFFEQKKKERLEAKLDPIKELLKTIPTEVKDRTVDNIYCPPPSSRSDYERGIDKVLSSQKEEEKACGKGVAQLGEQEAQSIAPLIVPSEPREIEHGEVVIGDTGLPIAEIVIQYKFELGMPLVENPSALTTQLYKLHTWYMTAAKEGRTYLMAGVKEQHLFREYAVQVPFSELFQMYNQLALDKSILSCYCL